VSDHLQRARRLGLHGLAAHLDESFTEDWPARLLAWEEEARRKRSLESRVKAAKLGRFKAMADFDWNHPSRIDRPLIEELFTLSFIEAGVNVIIVGPNGVGKSMLARNLAHCALVGGHSVYFTAASAMLNALAAEDSATALEKRLRKLCRPSVLVLDEVGYMSYGLRHADLLFEVISRRYERQRPVIVTTNRPFTEWGETFPNATCVVTLVDRLVHRCELVHVDGASFRLKESLARRQARSQERS
jgi:DNA replication protein DnaC